jgi:hypothetical protein
LVQVGARCDDDALACRLLESTEPTAELACKLCRIAREHMR